MTDPKPQFSDTQEATDSTRRALPGPLRYMIAASLAGSFMPLIIHLAGSSQSPFFINALLRAATAIGCIIFLLSFRRNASITPWEFSQIRKNILVWPANRPILWAIMGSMEYGLFALSTRFIRIPVTTILFEMHPVAIILMASWLFRGTQRYHQNNRATAIPIALSTLGLVLVNGSQLGGLGDITPRFLWTSLIGIGLAALGIASASLSLFGIRWGANLSRRLRPGEQARDFEFHMSVISYLMVSTLSAPISMAIGLTSGETMTAQAATITLAGALSANSVAGIAWRKSLLSTRNLGVNAVGFGTPVLSIFWLYWIGHAQVARWDYLAIGTAAIILANLIINRTRSTNPSTAALDKTR